jgi:hypothetical protein
VRPDLLGQAIEAYDKALPTITTLRLCHRYGKGPKVKITKLPIEILSAIEELAYHAIRTSLTTWSEVFHHFESRCELVDHLDVNDSIFRRAQRLLLSRSGYHSKNSDGGPDDDELKKAVRKVAGESLNGEEWKYCQDVCVDECDRWEELIAKGPGCNFQK